MLNRLVLVCAAAGTLPLAALHKEPWLPEMWHSHLDVSYTYLWFPKVNQGIPPLHHSFHDENLNANLDVVPFEDWSVELELEAGEATGINWGYRSSAVQIRYQYRNDIVGDPFSCTFGVSYRNASARLLRAVSTPYHAIGNWEANMALGKEWSHGSLWRYRCYLFEGLGIGSHGAPWSWTRLAGQFNWYDQHRCSLYLDGYFGFGSERKVFIDHFDGYAEIHHQSLSLALEWCERISVWGWLSLAYARTLYARSYPADANALVLRYSLPF